MRRARAVRWAVQLAFLALFVVFFLRTRYGLSPAWGDLFFRFDPLVLFVTSIAQRAPVVAALPALIFVAATFVFGRFFCGFVCPLGTTIDLADAAIRRRPARASRLRQGKYLVLLFLVAAALLGGSLSGFFDPLVILERTLALVAFPLAGGKVPLSAALYAAAGSFVVVILLGVFARRFWCRNLCPLGAIYAFASKFSVFKFSFTGECRECGACEKVCPTGAIDSSRRAIDSGECIDCLACRYRCRDKSVAYRRTAKRAPLDIGRREALVAVGSGLLLAPLARRVVPVTQRVRLLRPPGSIPERDFLAACLRCGRCVKACPTGAIQPAVFEAGANGLWTPRLVPRIGGCEKNCNLCGQVCPTGVIRKLSLEEKSYARIGNAAVDRNRCIAWAQDRVCLICDEACQYNAISSFSETIRGTALLRPFVNEKICVGCGICESRCPVAGEAAIRVNSLSEERKHYGTFKTDAKVEQRKCGDTPEEDVPSGFIQE